MKNLIISKLNPEAVNTGQAMFELLPEHVKQQTVWLLTDLKTGENGPAATGTYQKDASDLEAKYWWCSSQQLAAYFNSDPGFAFSAGVMTGFPLETELKHVLRCNIFPEWLLNLRQNDNRAYLQHPMAKLEITCFDGLYFEVRSIDEDLLEALRQHEQVNHAEYDQWKINTNTMRQITRTNAEVPVVPAKVNTGIGNWWLELDGQPIDFIAEDGLDEYLNVRAGQDDTEDVVGRIIFKPVINQLKTKSTLALKTDLEQRLIKLDDNMSDEWFEGFEFSFKHAYNQLIFGVTYEYRDEFATEFTFDRKREGVYDVNVGTQLEPAYFLRSERAFTELAFIVAWQYNLHDNDLLFFTGDFYS